MELYQSIDKGESTDVYSEFSDGFDEINTYAFSLIRNYEVLDGYFDEYNVAYLRFAKIELSALLINFTISFILLIVGPQVFTRDHIKFGNLITKTRRISSMGNNPSALSLVGKNVLTLLRGVLPFLIIGAIAFDFSVFTIPLFSIGPLVVNVIGTLAIALIVETVNAVFLIL